MEDNKDTLDNKPKEEVKKKKRTRRSPEQIAIDKAKALADDAILEAEIKKEEDNKKPLLTDLVDSINEENQQPLVDFGPNVGKEILEFDVNVDMLRSDEIYSAKDFWDGMESDSDYVNSKFLVLVNNNSFIGFNTGHEPSNRALKGNISQFRFDLEEIVKVKEGEFLIPASYNVLSVRGGNLVAVFTKEGKHKLSAKLNIKNKSVLKGLA